MADEIHMADAEADGDEPRTLQPLQAAAVNYRFDFAPGAGHTLLTLQGAEHTGPSPRAVRCRANGLRLQAQARAEGHAARDDIAAGGMR